LSEEAYKEYIIDAADRAGVLKEEDSDYESSEEEEEGRAVYTEQLLKSPAIRALHGDTTGYSESEL
jgi:hypothetical protein